MTTTACLDELPTLLLARLVLAAAWAHPTQVARPSQAQVEQNWLLLKWRLEATGRVHRTIG